MLPNWIIIGVPKASTSSLFRWLSDHPQVAATREKETCYFVDAGSHMSREDCNFRDHGLAGYERLFANCDPAARAIIEATPAYIYSQTALAELPKLASRPQFIVVLREPVAQLRSLHRYFQQNWDWVPDGMDFQKFIEAAENATEEFGGNELAANALSNTSYTRYLRAWRSAAGAGRLHIILFEDLVADSRATMRDLAGRMAINPDFYDSYAFPVENPTYVARSRLIQKLNIGIRGYLPQGTGYRLLRRAYRSLNTRAPHVEERDLKTEQRLALRYASMVEELEQDFGLDLTRWKDSWVLASEASRCSFTSEAQAVTITVGSAATVEDARGT